MHLKKQLGVGVAMAMLGITAAQASVVYNWQREGSGTGGLKVTFGRLILTDAAYRSGHVKIEQHADTDSQPLSGYPNPDSPILNLSFHVKANDGYYNPFVLSAHPRQGAYDNNPLAYDLYADIAPQSDGLIGSLSLNTNEESSISLSSGNRGLWSVDRFNSDAPSACYDHPLIGSNGSDFGCQGAIGRWKLDSALSDPISGSGGRSDVPAPPVWSLFGLAVLGLFGAARSKRRVVGISGKRLAA